MYVQLFFLVKFFLAAFNWTHTCSEESGMISAKFDIEFIRVTIDLDHWFYVRPALLLPGAKAI